MKRKLDDDTMALNDADIDTGEASDEEADHREISADQSNSRKKCPYLDTVNRQALDFDSEKLCSITLTNMNVYVCLVCGKYFQGRGKATPAYTHSVQAGHFVFMNLSSARTFCLPDGYEVFDPSLQDAQKCLSPSYTLQEVAELNSNTSLARDVHGVSYLPGFVGLNNLNCTDYINSLLHALAHVTPFRDFWLQSGHYEMSRSGLVQHFGLVSAAPPFTLVDCSLLFYSLFSFYLDIAKDVVEQQLQKHSLAARAGAGVVSGVAAQVRPRPARRVSGLACLAAGLTATWPGQGCLGALYCCYVHACRERGQGTQRSLRPFQLRALRALPGDNDAAPCIHIICYRL